MVVMDSRRGIYGSFYPEKEEDPTTVDNTLTFNKMHAGMFPLVYKNYRR